MNKISLVLTLFVLLFSFTMVKANVKNELIKNSISMKSNHSISNDLVARLETIKNMDKSGMEKEELANLLTEVRAIKTHLIAADGGIFISAGALIVILIVLLFVI